jgi:Trypsin-co-occurring domain 1
MTQLAPIKLADGTLIWIESTDVTTPSEQGLQGDDFPPQIRQLQTVEDTIRAYTNYTLNAFKTVANANIDRVVLEFGIRVGGESGIPYITKGTAESNLKITVDCSFPK